jgi:SAM-dependent methyltransferase
VHAFWLAELGYAVDLVDPVASQVRIARELSGERGAGRLRSAQVGDARALDADDASYDAVLLLGPLYHLVDPADRQAALREAARVVRPGGVVAAAVISRFASTLDGLARRLLDDPHFVEITQRDRATGVHLNPTGEARYFTTAYFHHPDEIGAEMRAAGIEDVRTLGIEGPAWLLQDLEEQWAEPTRRQKILDALAAIEAEPTLLGASAHLLALGRRPQR